MINEKKRITTYKFSHMVYIESPFEIISNGTVWNAKETKKFVNYMKRVNEKAMPWHKSD